MKPVITNLYLFYHLCLKSCEKIINSQIYVHLREHNLLSEAQFGFRKYHSTATCILMLMDIVYRNMDSGLLTGVAFLILKKAFDTVNHTILLNKLPHFNLTDRAIGWFSNYSTGRVQAVKSNGAVSPFLNITCGVLQGSILGPLLFTLYINDFANYLDEGEVSVYADDTALYVQAKSQIEIMLDLRIELSLVYE